MISFKVTTTEQNNKNGSFVVEPLENGFGHTLGNCLRRVLLTSLEGAAVSYVKIDGVTHQFSTISGVAEDVTEIILNLKKLRINALSDKPFKMILKASGKGEVKAKDIDTLGGGEIVNPDLHIASLTSPTAKLNIELTVEKGIGYVMADDKKSEELGVIPIDSIFSPVVAVTYQIDKTRVGRSTAYDKLILQVTTDGTTKPEDALFAAARTLSANFRQIYEPTFEEEVVVESKVSDDVLKLSVEELDLPVRITNALKAVEIDTVEKLITSPRSQLLKTKNLGAQSLTLISQKLEERGLSLGEA